MNLPVNELMSWLTEWFWPFLRIGACLMVAPVFGATYTPARTRLALAIFISLAVSPLLPPMPQVSLFSLEAIAIMAQQLLIGIAIGFVLQLVFDAIGLAGQLLANSMGLSFAFNVDPQRGAATAAVGQYYVIFMLLTFLALDGHLAVIELLVDGFAVLPVGARSFGAQGLWTLIGLGTVMFSGALKIALPGLTALLVANIAFGLISRAAPTLNIFSVGFPISIVFGLLVLQLGMPGVQAGFLELMTEAFEAAGQLQRTSP
jgi:flagellar biosynthetic protein FliR